MSPGEWQLGLLLSRRPVSWDHCEEAVKVEKKFGEIQMSKPNSSVLAHSSRKCFKEKYFSNFSGLNFQNFSFYFDFPN